MIGARENRTLNRRFGPPRALLLDFGGTLDAEGVPWKERFRALFAAELGDADPRLDPAVFDRVFYEADDALVGRVDRRATLDEVVGRLARGVAERLAGGAAANENLYAVAYRVADVFLRTARIHLSKNLSLLSSLSSSSAPSLRIGFVSNFYGNLAAVLQQEGYGAWVGAVADSACVGVTKPDPALFRHALDALGVAPTEALMVGDSWARDVVGASGAGMRAAWLAPAAHEAEREDVPVLRRLADVKSLLPARGRIEGAGVIAAGDGTRLRGAGLAAHKPLVAVAGLPLVAHVFDGLLAAGFRTLAVIFNDREEACATLVEERYREVAPRVLVKTTASSLESFGEVLRLLPGGRVLVSTVDALLPPTDLAAFVRAAEAMPPDAMVLAVTPFVDDEKPLRARVGADGRVLALGGDGDLVTAGLYVVPEALRRRAWPAGLGRLRELLAWVVSSGVDVRAVTIPKVVDVDRPGDVVEAERLLAGTGAP